MRIRAVSIHLESTRYGWFGRTRTARNGFDSRSRHHPNFFEIEHPTCPVLADVIHVAAALRAGGAITHGTHLLDG